MNEWLVMLYLGGDNSIFQFGQQLIGEATRVGSNGRVTIVAEIDPVSPNAETLRGRILQGRTELTKIGVTGNDASAIVAFVDDSKKRYEAKNRALILWDHGDGWQNVHSFARVAETVALARKDDTRRPAALLRAPAPKGDFPAPEQRESEKPDPLFLDDLRTVLDEQRDVAILGFDSCMMSMIEIAFQLRDTAQFMVASQHILPADRGWPYEAFLRSLTLNPQMEPEEVVRTTLDTFSGSYNGVDQPVTLTALRLSAEVERTVAAIDAFAVELLRVAAPGSAGREQILVARRYTQSFANPDYIDLISFTYEIAERIEDARLRRTGEIVRRSVRKLIVRHTRSSARSVNHANGVSIYFPDKDIAKSYDSLDFAKEEYCRWRMFLDTIQSVQQPAAKKVREWAA